MLIELKRCNSIGNINGLLFLISIIANKEKIGWEEIRNRCALENGIAINCSGAVAFLEYLGLVRNTVSSVTPCPKLDELAMSQEAVISNLVKLGIDALINDGIFDENATGFDPAKGHLTIKRSAFPLSHAAIRNFLTIAGALDKEVDGEISVTSGYENDWISHIKDYRKRLTLNQLLKQQEEQSKRGLEAEEFVLRLEKGRLPRKASQIKRISDFDVSAGYDIVSYADNDSTCYDRFIEVKCYIGTPHFFWSENECDIAKIKAGKYILCLVDYQRINEPDYYPEYIYNPHEAIFDDIRWLVNTASYRIQII